MEISKEVNFKVFTKQELAKDCKELITLYYLKVERDWLEKHSSDGNYYELDTLEELQDSIRTLKRKYKKINIIDEENLLGSPNGANKKEEKK